MFDWSIPERPFGEPSHRRSPAGFRSRRPEAGRHTSAAVTGPAWAGSAASSGTDGSAGIARPSAIAPASARSVPSPSAAGRNAPASATSGNRYASAGARS